MQFYTASNITVLLLSSLLVLICSVMHVLRSQVSSYLLQTAQSWANAGVTEGGHCQGACRPQWFFYVPN